MKEEHEIKMPEQELSRHLENIKFMKALYGHCKAYVECMPQDKGAFCVSPNSNKWVTELDLTVGTDWQIRRMKLEIVDWLMTQNIGMEFIKSFRIWLFEHKFSTKE